MSAISKVGGIIYYIDSNSTNTYTFYDSNFNVVDAPREGNDYTNYYYIKNGTSVDKYYVYNTSAMFGKDRAGTELSPFIAWPYLGTGNQSFIDNVEYMPSDLPSSKQAYEYCGYYGRVYESLYKTYTGTTIGTGKVNTLNMMSLRGGVYIQGSNLRWKGQTTYSETIWSICNLFNKGLYSLNGSFVPNTTGCNDWYIPSLIELLRMKDRIGAENFSNMFPGDPDYTFVWTSSEYNQRTVYSWAYDGGLDTGSRNSPKGKADADTALALIRSF